MAATISASGTWTDLGNVFDATKSKEVGNEPRLHGPDAIGSTGPQAGGLGINLQDLKTVDGVIFPEFKQFIQLVATQYGLYFWQAAVLIEITLKALLFTQRSGGGSVGDETGNRVYTP
jgi:hypothetical protein